MLRTLELFDFAIADRVRIELQPGLNVISGETGAGKSLLVDALALLAGDRADASVIRVGAEAALVQATWLGADELVVSRRIVREGRNLARVNGEVVSVAELQAELNPRLGIFGQQAYRTLLDGDEQRALLDRHLNPEGQALAQTLRTQVSERRQLQEALQQLTRDLDERDRRREVLTFQISEIDAAQLKAGEEASLDARLSTLRHVERVREHLQAAHAAFSAGDAPAESLLADAVRALNAASRFDRALETLARETQDALAAVQAIGSELERAMERLESEPGELDALETRRAWIESLARKYARAEAGAGASESILLARASMAQALATLEEASGNIGTIKQRLASCERNIQTLAGQLTQARVQVATPLAQAVQASLQTLALAHGRFEIELQATEGVHAHGAERVVFLFSANLGERLMPLSSVASGGELSRVMLALHAAAGSDTPTLVFDEVDAGLGGRSGRAVGRVLKQLARERQVLVVTHLAQVAAFADHHVRVDKDDSSGRTRSQPTTLEGEARVHEIARMLGGDNSAAALAHARELLANPDSVRS